MGFDRRKIDDERRQVADAELAVRRATDAQVLEDAKRLIDAWNERRTKRLPMLFSPTVGAAIAPATGSFGCGVRPAARSARYRRRKPTCGPLSKHSLRWPAFQRVGKRRIHVPRFGVRHDLSRLHVAGHAINAARDTLTSEVGCRSEPPKATVTSFMPVILTG